MTLDEIPAGNKINLEEVGCFLNSNGSFGLYYCHMLPALFMNQLLSDISARPSSQVEMHVLCMGDLIGSGHPWTYLKWTEGKVPAVVTEVLTSLYTSDAFKRVVDRVKETFNSRDKPIRRVCVWFRVRKHVNTLWWETTKDGSVCFMADNIDELTKLSEHIVSSFRNKVSRLIHKNVCTFSRSEAENMLYAKHIVLGDRMMCVSYMSRVTLYLSMVDFPSFKNDNGLIKPSDVMSAAGEFSDVAGCYLEENMFMDFLSRLTLFVEEASKQNKLVLLSPIESTFANIEDVFLRTVKFSPAAGEKRLTDYEYQGSPGFVEKGVSPPDGHNPKTSCSLSTHFTLLPHIRECKLLLDAMRLYKSV